ncbi:hypothetical protein HYPSUDRAFT_36858 [Hypholoma sublateritium FD-334 SS-4]|uniref:Anti-proliferative protein domain-containing protein n=1 Tax=Hypholoma sublateritium (strain FD-334 SS-4) TaxID=945553 RepID=A0A0D2LEN8_HYPSF|nr:hypothetical protein HYPSUDRAFT_36858 [Hypholoma sublateritium FD-334 SS-4]
MASSSESLSLAVAHAIAFLTAKLRDTYAPNTLLKLQMVLEANLTAHYAPSWAPKDPVRGSGRRCMTLSPDCLPPRPVWTACTAANVQWFDWIAALGNNEFDLFVDPGCVAIRFREQIINVWVEQPAAPVAPQIAAPVFSAPMLQAALRTQQAPRKTFAQRVLEEDREEEETIFTMLADEISAPTWMTPILTQFPMPGRSTSPMSSISEQSRCSSRSSDSSSSGFSFSSAETASSRTSAASTKTGEVKQSRRERARQARVFVDTSKTDVTPYDGGKTTVLTGGVMLGGGKPAAKPRNLAAPAAATAGSWRAARA